MQILHQDREAGEIELRPDSLDDLWHLHHIVEPGDHAEAFTHRTRSQDDDKIRAESAEKEGMVLTVEVEDIEFHEFSNRLRLRGPIVDGPRDLGEYHTLNVEEHDELTITKPDGWRDVHLDRLQQAVDASERPRVTFLAMDDDEAAVAVLRQYGVDEVGTIEGPKGGKQYEDAGTGSKTGYWGDIAEVLERVRPEGAPLVVVGPGFAKGNFLDWARENHPGAVEGAITEDTGQAGMTGVQEAMKRGLADRVAKEARVAKETKLVEDLLSAVSGDEPATYGADHVDRALELGAVETLIVTDERVRKGPGEEELERAEQKGAECHVISTGHEAGAKLEAVGGVGALLRYEVGEAELARGGD
jgi:protein pelota